MSINTCIVSDAVFVFWMPHSYLFFVLGASVYLMYIKITQFDYYVPVTNACTYALINICSKGITSKASNIFLRLHCIAIENYNFCKAILGQKFPSLSRISFTNQELNILMLQSFHKNVINWFDSTQLDFHLIYWLI